MRFPNFLVIGAMKSGTTSLCRDLEAQPKIFFPSVKEPHTLTLPGVLKPEGRRKYAALFREAGPDQICGEGSTGYTKLPRSAGVTERAWKLLGSDLKLIYIVREPVARTLSHHYHLYRSGRAPADAAAALRSIPDLTDVSRYAMQLEPWIERFGRDNVFVVRFESFIDSRAETVEELCEFLGVPVRKRDVNADKVHNAADEQLLPPQSLREMINSVTRSQWYKRSVHPRIPQWVRDQFKSIFYEEPKERPAPPSADVVEDFIAELEPDLEKLREIMGYDDPVWDMSAVRRRYERRTSQYENA